MAKAFLIRWGSQNDFEAIKLQTRELGYAIDTIRLYIGSEDGNIHIPNESFIMSKIAEEVPKYKVAAGTTVELNTVQLNGAFGFNTDIEKITYKTSSGGIKTMAYSSDLPTKTGYTVVVAVENIDAGDNNSVTLTDYERPIELIFLNGKLCTTHANDSNKYLIDSELKTLKIDGCEENDLITYF